ncbi:MAG: hypothetical protein IJP66_03685, partial [Kiritimatiellae bacterium]|nr:hypothetical protein [Kiritimatiellia bacterium]
MRHAILALLAGLIAWAAITWPLPARFSSSVTVADYVQPGAPRVLGTMPGDHLQLLYHFWLAGEALAGGPRSNIFEFNAGSDAPLRRFDPHYIPFSLVFAAAEPILGRAAAWNAAGLFSVLLGVAGLFLLALRLSRSRLAALLVAIALCAFPYRWSTLIAGSPTGFAIALVPWLAYGIDRLARDASAAGSAIAGLALLLSFCSDLHTFYFAALAAPLFAATSAVLPRHNPDAAPPPLRRLAGAAIPLAALALLAAILSKAASSGLASSTMAAGRAIGETLLFSPALPGLFTTRRLAGATNSIYIGTVAAAFLALALMRLAASATHSPASDRRPAMRALAAAALLLAAALAIILLSAGAYGPRNGLLFRLARAAIPKYTMIRQPAKIFCLLPTVLAMLSATALAGLSPRGLRRRPLDLICCALAIAIPLQQSSRFHAAVSL